MNYEQGTTQSNRNVEDLKNVGSFKWGKFFRFFLYRIPLWSVLTVFLGVGSWVGYLTFSQEGTVNLRPAVTNAIEVRINIDTCNKQIDKQDINIREEEQRIEKQLRAIEGVKNASVLIQRDQKNCDK